MGSGQRAAGSYDEPAFTGLLVACTEAGSSDFPAPTPGADLHTQLRAVGKTIAEAARRTSPGHDLLVGILETFVKVLTTLTTGLIMAHSMSPDDFGEDVIVAAFEALAGPEA